METPKSTETQNSHLWCTTQDYWSGFTATGPLDGWDQWWQDRCGCCRHRWGDLVQVKRVGMRQNGISILASGYSVLIRYIMYFFTLCKYKQWYIIHNMLFFCLCLYVCFSSMCLCSMSIYTHCISIRKTRLCRLRFPIPWAAACALIQASPMAGKTKTSRTTRAPSGHGRTRADFIGQFGNYPLNLWLAFCVICWIYWSDVMWCVFP